MNHETEQPHVIPLRARRGNGSQQPMATSGRHQVAHPFVTWRVPGGPCWRAWIDRTHSQAGARFLFSVQTDSIDGNAIGEPISAPVYHDMADTETLLAYVMASLEPDTACELKAPGELPRGMLQGRNASQGSPLDRQAMTVPSDQDIARAVHRLGRAYRARDFIAHYLKAGRPLEAETTSTLHERWAQHRQVPVTAENQ